MEIYKTLGGNFLKNTGGNLVQLRVVFEKKNQTYNIDGDFF